MALVLADRVNETTTTAGTGTLTLAGAVTGYQSFSVVGNANTTYYTIVGQTTGEWEVGIGTYTSAGTTLSRDTVLASSAGGTTKVTLSAGTKFVFCDYPAGRAVYLDTASNATIPGITLSGGTANGVAYLNASKVLTTGSALTFDGTNLALTGSTRLNQLLSGAGIQMQNTAATANWFIATSSADLSFTSAQNGAAIWSINGSEQMRLTSTGLGIGTSSPSYKLDVVGGQRINAVTGGYIDMAYNGTVVGNLVAASGLLYVNTQTTNTAINANGGNLGIGTTSPVERLQVSGGGIKVTGTSTAASGSGAGVYLNYVSASNYGEVLALDQGVAWKSLRLNAADILFYIAGGEQMRLTTSGNLGIGTSSPGNKLTVNGAASAVNLLQVTGTSGASQGVLKAQAGSGATLGYNRSRLDLLSQAGTAGWSIYNYGDAADLFAIAVYGGSDVINVTQAGNVGIGTSSPSARFNVSGGSLPTSSLGYGLGISAGLAATRFTTDASNLTAFIGSYYDNSSLEISQGSTSGYASGIVIAARSATNATVSDAVAIFTRSAERLRVDGSGNVGIGTTSPTNPLTVVSDTSAQIRIGTVSANINARITLAATGTGLNVFGTTGVGPIAFLSGSTEQMRLDTSGNLGVGVIPSAWISYQKGVDFGGAGNYGAINARADFVTFSNNLYLNASNNWTYKNTGAAQDFYMSGGAFVWRSVGSGTAGTTAALTQPMTLDASGRLGIGTTSPTAGIHVETGTNSSGGGLISVTGEAYGPNSISSRSTIYDVAGTVLRITAAANSVNAGALINFNAYNSSAGATGAFIGAVAGPTGNGPANLVFGTRTAAQSWAENARIDTSGNFGLGVTPSAWYSNSKAAQIGYTSVASNAATGWSSYANNAYQSAASDTTGWKYYSTNPATLYHQSLGAHAWYVAPSGTAGNAITFTQAMTLDASGNLLVGKTAINNTVVGNELRADGQTYATRAATTDAAQTLHVFSSGAGAYRFYVGMGGTVFATNTTISAISDRRLKENIQDLDVGLDQIMALKPRKFDWKTGKGKDIKGDRGFIAQEFEQVFPDLIDKWKDPAPEGEEPYKSVRQDLIPVLVKAMQEQQALIESLTARLNVLENK